MATRPSVGRPRFDVSAGTTVVDVEVDGDDSESIFAALEAAAEAFLPHFELSVVRPPQCMGAEDCESEPSVKLKLELMQDGEAVNVHVELCASHFQSDLEKVLASVVGS